jgi:peptidoglycan/LPS O-acetylase OafA/YrhL
MRTKAQYVMLDGLRGLAAIAVVLYHCQSVWPAIAPHSAYLAVDFFFVLSGFVLAHAYQRRLDQRRIGLIGFLRARILRLYPLYLCGTILTLGLLILARVHAGAWSGTWEIGQLGVAAGCGILMLPDPLAASLYPLNVPAWSLWYELLANAAFASVLRRVFHALCGLAALAVIGVGWNAGPVGLDTGAYWDSLGGGFARVMFGFPAGVLLYGWLERSRLRWTLPTWLPVTGLLLVLCLDVHGSWRPIFDVVVVLIVSPCLIVAGAQSTPRTRLGRTTAQTLGMLSYPIYVLQYPFIATMHTLSVTWLIGGLLLTILLVLAWALGSLDQRLRHRMWRPSHMVSAGPIP